MPIQNLAHVTYRDNVQNKVETFRYHGPEKTTGAKEIQKYLDTCDLANPGRFTLIEYIWDKDLPQEIFDKNGRVK